MQNIVIDAFVYRLRMMSSDESHLQPRKPGRQRHFSLSRLDTKPSLPLEEYAGTYSHPVYGNIALCTRLPPKPIDSGFVIPDMCANLRHDFNIVYAAENSTITSSQLIAHSPRLLARDFRLQHLQADTFSISVLTLFPYGYGADKSPFAYDGVSQADTPTAAARFILGDNTESRKSGEKVNGFFASGILGDMADVEGDRLTGKGAKPLALVWFRKLSTQFPHIRACNYVVR